MPYGWPPDWPVPRFVSYRRPQRDAELDYPAYRGKATSRGLHSSAARSDDEQLGEIRRLAVGALGPPIVIPTRGEDGSITSHVSWPKRADRRLAETIALASLPLDFEPINRPTPKLDRESEAALTAAANRAEAGRRRAIVDQRRRDAEAMFAAAERPIVERWQARQRREALGRYVRARAAASYRRRAKRQR
jgi:hypothetical protein